MYVTPVHTTAHTSYNHLAVVQSATCEQTKRNVSLKRSYDAAAMVPTTLHFVVLDMWKMFITHLQQGSTLFRSSDCVYKGQRWAMERKHETVRHMYSCNFQNRLGKGGLIPQSSVRSFLSAKFSETTGKSRTPLWTSDRDVSGSLLQRLRIQTNIIHILCMPLEATARKTGLILKVNNVQTNMPVFGST